MFVKSNIWRAVGVAKISFKLIYSISFTEFTFNLDSRGLSTEFFAKKALSENIGTAKRRKKELQTYIDENSTLLYGMVSDNLQSAIKIHLESIIRKVNS